MGKLSEVLSRWLPSDPTIGNGTSSVRIPTTENLIELSMIVGNSERFLKIFSSKEM
jgi:hypothetical protein